MMYALWALLIFAAPAISAMWQDPAPVPIYKEPRHVPVFESGTTMVLDVRIAPGDTTLFHIHDVAILYVPISSSRTRSQALGEEWPAGRGDAAAAGSGAAAAGRGGAASAAPAGPGRPSSITSYVDKPLTHRVNNIGDTLFRLIATTNRTAGAVDDKDDVSGLSPKPEVVNKWFRAHRVALKAGQAGSMHRHATPVVLVMQTPGRISIEGSSKMDLTMPGTFSWHDGTGTHTVRNSGTTDVEFIEVEVRGAQPK